MRFFRGKDKSKYSLGGIFSGLSAALSFEAFRENSWAKWSAVTFLDCLPLPPPLGCYEFESSREVLTRDETDFAWLTFLSIIPSLTCLFAIVVLATDQEYEAASLKELSSKKSRSFLSLLSASLNLLTFIVTIFRVGVATAKARSRHLFNTAGLSASYSTSYYLVILATICSILAVVCQHRYEDGDKKSFQLVRTIKQHVARSLMHPVNKGSSKMITFSSMTAEMEEAAAEIAVRASMNLKLEEDIAEHIKQKFESKFGPTWHCAVGETFGSAVHHRSTEYIEIALPDLSILLFRCGEPNIFSGKGKARGNQSSMSDSSLC